MRRPEPTSPAFDNSKQLRRVRSRFAAYRTIATGAVRNGVSPISMIATKFPFALPDRARPASLSIELTDACNLKCDYCTNPTFANPRTYMSSEVFEALLTELERFPVERIRVGGGEATLHPKFAEFSRELADRTRFLSIVTNAQWPHRETAAPLIDAYDMVEVSVDGGGPEQYETTRMGASFERLERNLAYLMAEKRRRRARTIVNLRLMLRPSSAGDRQREIRRWNPLCDSVMPQYVVQQRDDEATTDVFVPVQIASRSIPRCTLPFKDLPVRSTGEVHVCQVNGTTNDVQRRIALGRVGDDSLESMWHSDRLRRVRRGHRTRDSTDIEFCRGCSGR